MSNEQPEQRPERAFFSSGPCGKRPGWSLDNLSSALLGRSHRSAACKARLARAIDETRELLGLPENYRVAIVPASDTGAMEMAMWSMLGPRGVDVFAWEAFSKDWVIDITSQLDLSDIRVFEGEYGILPDLAQADFSRDIVFPWNGTTSGVRVPDGAWIDEQRAGLTICDATSAVWAQDIAWNKLDVVTYSWQKVLGSEAAHGMLILSPRAVERLESFEPARPLPKIFRMTKNGKLIENLFKGETINTPSMLCVEDYLDALAWVRAQGGVKQMIRRADDNFAAMRDWVEQTDWVDFLAVSPETRSNTSICLRITDPRFTKLDEDAQRALIKEMEKLLADHEIAFDIAGYRAAPPGLRIWAGGMVERDDLEKLCPWLNWAFHQNIK